MPWITVNSLQEAPQSPKLIRASIKTVVGVNIRSENLIPPTVDKTQSRWHLPKEMWLCSRVGSNKYNKNLAVNLGRDSVEYSVDCILLEGRHLHAFEEEQCKDVTGCGLRVAGGAKGILTLLFWNVFLQVRDNHHFVYRKSDP